MNRIVRHLLLLLTLLGLLGQGVAFASPPCAEMAKTQTVSMAHASAMEAMPDCANCDHDANKDSTPCKHMTAGCLAMSGCGALVALDVLSPVINKPVVTAATVSWPSTSVLHGRGILPELDPPSNLG